MIKTHPFHIVQIRPWPLTISIIILALTLSITNWIHINYTLYALIILFAISFCAFSWWRDVTRETNFEGLHPKIVIQGLKLGIIFFISSEVLFFFSFFWGYFQRRISPNIDLGEIWPPLNIQPFDPINIPLLNTLLLLSSGVSITWSHHLLLENHFKITKFALLLTIILGVLFSILQAFEYIEAPFSFSDAVYGRSFFLATGFHGIHVLIGSSFLAICALQINFKNLTFNHTIGFETAAWYWHFVDVVWLFLYVFIYWWGIYLY